MSVHPAQTAQHRPSPGEVERLGREIISALRRLRDPRMPAPPRVYRRVRWQMSVRVRIETEIGRAHGEEHRVETLDIGPQGFAFVYGKHLQRGALISVALPLAAGDKHVDGVVRYCQQLGPRQYRIGVRFMRVSSEPAAD